MNGGKDFSEWSKKDDLLYRTLRTPVEAVLKKDGVGLADCAVAESKFEKGENITERMLALIPQVSEIQQKGTPDIEFAVNGLLARCQLTKGQAADARTGRRGIQQRRWTRVGGDGHPDEPGCTGSLGHACAGGDHGAVPQRRSVHLA